MNKDIFIRVYKNKILNNNINSHIRYINKKIHKDSRKLDWNRVTQDPRILAHYGYYNQFKLISSYLDSFDIIEECGIIAARCGHLNILKYIIENFKPGTYSMVQIFSKALVGGNISVIEYLYSLKSWDEGLYSSFFVFSAESGRTEVCEWFINHFKDMKMLCEPNSFYFYASLSGNLDVLKWGIQFFDTVIEDTNHRDIWRTSIDRNNVSLLEFMYNHEVFTKSFDIRKCLVGAIIDSKLEVINWIFSKNNDTSLLEDEEIYIALVNRCSLKIIEYCSDKLGYSNKTHKNHAEWLFKKCEHHGFNAIDLAISNYKYKIAIWLYANTNFQGTLDPLLHCESLELLKFFTENNRPERISTDTLARLGSKDRDITIVEYIIRNRTEQFPDLQRIMAFLLLNSETMELLDMLSKSNEFNLDTYTLHNAISENRMGAIKWIHQNKTSALISQSGIRSAYFLKDSTMIEWLHQNRTESCDPEYIRNNFSSCSTSTKQFILHNKPDMIPSNVLEKVKDLTLSKFIIDNYSTQFIKDDSLFSVTKSENVEIVKYLHHYYKNHNIDQETNHFDMKVFKQSLEYAINYKYIEIVKYLCENGPIIKDSKENELYDPMLIACQYGRLSICKYLQEHTPYKLHSDHIDVASIDGNLEMVQWIYETHGIKCSIKGLETSATNQHFEVIRYLLDNKHELTSKMFEMAIESTNLEFVKICQEYQCKYDFNVVDLASSCGSFEIVKYLVENGHKGSTNAIDSACEHGYLDIIIFLKDSYHECSPDAIDNATNNSHFDIVKWLMKNFKFY